MLLDWNQNNEVVASDPTKIINGVTITNDNTPKQPPPGLTIANANTSYSCGCKQNQDYKLTH